jgi:predicted nucleotidyltransferase
MKALSVDIINKIVQNLVKEFAPEKIILFGSYAWGRPKKDSDLDLFVIISESDSPPVQRAIRAHRCLRGVDFSKDILVRTRSEVEKFMNVHASLEAQVLEEGKIIYERT